MADKLNKEDLKFRGEIAARLREIRESTGKNQTEFSYDLGVDSQAVSRYETGKGASVYVIKRYCQLAGLPLKDFFNSPLFK
jgi:transcriptional regulator with XRE-family HTH domain